MTSETLMASSNSLTKILKILKKKFIFCHFRFRCLHCLKVTWLFSRLSEVILISDIFRKCCLATIHPRVNGRSHPPNVQLYTSLDVVSLPGLPPHISTTSDKGWGVKAWIQGYLKCTQDFTDHTNKKSIQVPLTNIQGILISLHISRDGLQNIS